MDRLTQNLPVFPPPLPVMAPAMMLPTTTVPLPAAATVAVGA